MRYIPTIVLAGFLALALALVLGAPAFGQHANAPQCVGGERAKLEEGIAAIDAGKVPAIYLRGKELAAFMDDAGLHGELLAVFLIDQGGEKVFAWVVDNGTHPEVIACFVKASPKAIELFRKHYGQGV